MSAPAAGDGPVLVLGPLLRHVDPVSATVWLETDRACEVAVLGRRARTFRVRRHHTPLAVGEALDPGTPPPYAATRDGVPVGPPRQPPSPPSRIRTPGPPGAFRIAFGSCRYATPGTV